MRLYPLHFCFIKLISFICKRYSFVKLAYASLLLGSNEVSHSLVVFNLTPPILLSFGSSSHLLTRLAVSHLLSRPPPAELYSVSSEQDSERWDSGSNLSLFGDCQHTTERRKE